jgi:hypothetical protein
MPTRRSQPRARPTRGWRLSTVALDKLERDAAVLAITPTQHLENLILETGPVHTDYFAQQAAVEAFIAAGLITALAAKTLPAQEVREIRDQGAKLAAQLYGEPRRRPGEVGSPPDDGDPRVRALFEVFGAG